MGEGGGGRRASTISCGLHCLAEALGDRAHDRVDHAQPEDEPGLRVLVRDDGSSDLRGDDPADAQKTRQCRLMTTSQTPSESFCHTPIGPRRARRAVEMVEISSGYYAPGAGVGVEEGLKGVMNFDPEAVASWH